MPPAPLTARTAPSGSTITHNPSHRMSPSPSSRLTSWRKSLRKELGLGDCEGPIVTGWENERRIFEESLFAGGADEEIFYGTVLGSPNPIGGAGDFGIDLAYLSADIAGIIDDRRPQDSTAMRKPRQRKRALGQKSDEQDQNHGQQM